MTVEDMPADIAHELLLIFPPMLLLPPSYGREVVEPEGSTLKLR
jgi:hypothetical protein